MKNKYAIPLAVLIILILGIFGSVIDIKIEEKKGENRERYLSGYYDEPVLKERFDFTKDWDSYQMHGFSIRIPPLMEVKDTNCIHPPNMYDYHWKRRRIKSPPSSLPKRDWLQGLLLHSTLIAESLLIGNKGGKENS